MKTILFSMLLFLTPSSIFPSSSVWCAVAQEVPADNSGASASLSVSEDQHPKCKAWSLLGECELNAGYMRRSCATSCHEYEEALAAVTPKDLYSISEVDFHGNPFHFRDHRQQRIFVTNAAATPDEPFTDANFRLLATLSKFRSQSFELLLFPSFQLEKGGNKDPYFVTFYAQQSGFEGVVMRHGDVNGIHRSDTFKYLLGKELRGSTIPIRGNFHGKFFVDPSGQLDLPASELVTALFTSPRSATISVQSAKNALLFEVDEDEGDEDDLGGAVQSAVGELGSGSSGSAGGGRGGNGVLLGVVRELCDRHLCRWFRLSAHDCGQLRMQVLMDVY